MESLTKIRDVSLTYGVSVRTLRYYEDVGLLTSMRDDSSSYRSYTPEQLHRLQQILLLRKLQLSIKEIKQIFASENSQVLLTLLCQKADEIDDNIASLTKLKHMVLTFLDKIKLAAHSDLKLLLTTIEEFESQIAEQEPILEPNFLDMKEVFHMNSFPDVRVIFLPPCQMVSSGHGNFGDDNFDRFDQWFSQFPIQPFEQPKDFLWFDTETKQSVWWYLYSEGMNTDGFLIEDFDGGFYVAAVSKDGDDEDGYRVYSGIKDWIAKSGIFELDERPGHYTMSHIITTPETEAVLGYCQLEVLVPVKKK